MRTPIRVETFDYNYCFFHFLDPKDNYPTLQILLLRVDIMPVLNFKLISIVGQDLKKSQCRSLSCEIRFPSFDLNSQKKSQFEFIKLNSYVQDKL